MIQLRHKINYSLCFLLVAAINLSAKEYLVHNAAEIASTMALVQPGDTLTMSPGYWYDQVITIHGNGTAEAPILLRVKKPGEVRLSGNSRLRISGSWLIVDGLLFQSGSCSAGQSVIEFRSSYGRANHCRLTNTVIIDYNPSNVNVDYKWVSVYGQNNRVDHCRFENKTHSGTTLVVWLEATNDQQNYHRIDHNYFGPRPPLGFNGGETIRVGTSETSLVNSYTIVEYNVFEKCNGETEIISNKSCGNIYRYNTFIDCEGCLTLRHGNNCTVEGNFFFGDRISGTGGVRIIGEDHKVINNYFQDLNGSGYTSALCMVKGVVNSPLNRYFQVKRALVAFNTFINCTNTFLLGYGTDTDQTLPPVDCTIANNIVQSNGTVIKIGDSQGTPVNFIYEGNIFWGSSLGIANPGGISWQNPQLTLAEDGLYRPTESSPVRDAAQGDYARLVTIDIDGQLREQPLDVGCDEISTAPRSIFPLTKEDVSPIWYKPGPYVIPVSAGTGTLNEIWHLLAPGDTLELVSDGGLYLLTSPLVVDKPIVLRSPAGLTFKPIIRPIMPTANQTLIIRFERGRLDLTGVIIDGDAQWATSPAALISASSTARNYTFKANDCHFTNVHSQIFRADVNSQADTISLTSCLLSAVSDTALQLHLEAPNSSQYNVRYLEMVNCTSWNINKQVLSVYGGDEIPFTLGPYVRIDHCTFDACGQSGVSILDLDQVDLAIITNSIFSNSPSNPSIRLFGWSYIAYCDLFMVGPVALFRGATQKEGIVSLDPGYRDPLNGDFTLSKDSPVINLASDGRALGDLRWAESSTRILLDMPNQLPERMTFQGCYPNPFNASMRIRYTVEEAGIITLCVYDLNGRLVSKEIRQLQRPGTYEWEVLGTGWRSGIYLGQLGFDQSVTNFKMMMVK